MEKNLIIILLGTMFIFSLSSGSYSANEISKCQDADGNWHYGDHVAAECAFSSEITALDESGTQMNKIAPPPTREQLEAAHKKKKQQEVEQKKRQKQVEQDWAIVQIYGSEDIIIAARDRKLESIDNNLEITKQLKQGILIDIEKLKASKQTEKIKQFMVERKAAIKSYNQVIKQSQAERKKLELQYQNILRVFRNASARLNPED